MGSRLLQVLTVVGLIGLMALAGSYFYQQDEPLCEICLRPIHQANGYTIELASGERIEACCPRCGLRFQQTRTDVVSTWAKDFSTGATLDAQEAYYVEDSAVTLCRLHDEMVQRDAQGNQFELDWDRCEPSLISFRLREDAAAFVHDNGGVIRTYAQLLEEEF